MSHINIGKNEHDYTVTAYVIRLDGDQPKALLHMHKKHNKLLPIGGHIEKTETPWQAIAHELKEESGYDISDLKILQPINRITKLSKVDLHPYPVSMNTHDISADHFHTDIEYAFVTDSYPKNDVDPGESNDLRWLTNDELNDLDESQIFDGVKEIYNFIFDEVLNNWQKVSTDEFRL